MVIWLILGPAILVVMHMVYIKKMRALKEEAIDASNAYYINAKELCEKMRELAQKPHDKEMWLRHRDAITPKIELIKSKYQTNIFDLKQRAFIKVQLDDLETLILSNDQRFN